MVVITERSSHTCQGTSVPWLWGRCHQEARGWMAALSWVLGTFPEIPEDANEQLQGDVLDLAVECLLPGPSAGAALVQVCAGAQVSQAELRVQPEVLDPGRKQTQLHGLSVPAVPRERDTSGCWECPAKPLGAGGSLKTHSRRTAPPPDTTAARPLWALQPSASDATHCPAGLWPFQDTTGLPVGLPLDWPGRTTEGTGTTLPGSFDAPVPAPSILAVTSLGPPRKGHWLIFRSSPRVGTQLLCPP